MFGDEQEGQKPSFPSVLDDTVVELDTAVFQTMGFASACWPNLEKAGVFQSDMAKAACDELVAWIETRYTLRPQGPDWDSLTDPEKLDIIHRLEVQTHTLLHSVAKAVGVEGHHG